MLKKIGKYKLVLFKDKQILPNPYYSLPFYDKKGISISKLEKIIKKEDNDFAVIYDNITKQKLHYYSNKQRFTPKNEPVKIDYGKDISRYRLWAVFEGEKSDKTIVRYSLKSLDDNDLEKSYWNLVNENLKPNRKNLKNAKIFDNQTNTLIGEFVKSGKYDIRGRGIYHKEKF